MEVVIDLDEVISDLSTPFQAELFELTGKDIPVEQWHDYCLGNVYGIDKEVVSGLLLEKDILWKAMPFAGAVEALASLQKRGFTTHIVTARKEFDEKGVKTKAWLNDFSIPFDHLHITCRQEGKLPVVKEINPVFMIDDHYKNLYECRNHVFQSVLINRPWNKLEGGQERLLHRVDSLAEAVALI